MDTDVCMLHSSLSLPMQSVTDAAGSQEPPSCEFIFSVYCRWFLQNVSTHSPASDQKGKSSPSQPSAKRSKQVNLILVC